MTHHHDSTHRDSTHRDRAELEDTSGDRSLDGDGQSVSLGLRDPSASFTATLLSQAMSVWMSGQQDAKTQRAGRYVPASVAHPAKMLPAIAAHAIHHYTRPGDIVLDPMCGIGTTLVEAVRAGRHAIGTEYESRWTSIARTNLALARRADAAGIGRVVCADARDLPKVVHPALADLLGDATVAHLAAPGEPADPRTSAWDRPVSLVLTSPPYGSHTHGQVTAPGPGQAVGKSDFRYSPTRRGSGNLAHADLDDLLAGFTAILVGAITLLRPGGHVVLTTRPYRRGGELIDLPSAVIAAAQDAGLTFIDRNPALMAGLRQDQLIPRASFFQLLAARKARAAGIPQQVTVHEDVLTFAYSPPAPQQAPGRVPPAPHSAGAGKSAARLGAALDPLVPAA